MTISADGTELSLARAPVGRSLWQDAWRRLRANRAAMASLIFLGAMALVCVAVPPFLPNAYDTQFRDYVKVAASLEAYPRPEQVEPAAKTALERARVDAVRIEIADGRLTADVTARRPIDPRISQYLNRTDLFRNAEVTNLAADKLSATLTAEVAQRTFLFGTDSNGRDLLARVLVGGRISLTIGLLATGVALLLGVSFGAISGYAGGRIDLVMMRFVDILYSLPFVFFVILLVVFFGRSWILMFVAVGCIEWLDMARIVRGQTLAIKRQEYVQAAHALGVPPGGVVRRHIVPNLLGPVVIYVTLLVPKVILLESFLSFLGLGVQEPLTSWGVLIAEGVGNTPGAWWMLLFPSVFLTGTLFALNFLGDGLRDALDPRDR